jgi:hypothetical protein
MNYDTHDPDNTPEDESMEWDGEYPAGWGMDEDYGNFGGDW